MIQAPKPKASESNQALIQASIYQMCQQAELKIFDKFYKSQKSDGSLYVLKQKQYVHWIESCMQQGSDSEPKFYRIAKPLVHVQCARECTYRFMDADTFVTQMTVFVFENLTTVAKMLDPGRNVVGSFSNSFPLLAKPTDECFVQIMTERTGMFCTEFDQQVRQCSFETLFSKYFSQVPPSQRILRAKCPQNAKPQVFLGYCELCKETGHQLTLQLANSLQDLPNSHRLKVIDIGKVRTDLLNDFKQNIQKQILIRLMMNDHDMMQQLGDYELHLDELDNSYRAEQDKKELLQNDLYEIKRYQKQIVVQQNDEEVKNQSLEIQLAKVVLSPQLQVSTFYDVVIKCDSILQLTTGDGWSVQITGEDYHTKKAQNTVIVSFYGLYNKGKTFMASKLSKKQLPLGYSVSTVGLSALYPQDLVNENAIVFLDTAGTETPICYQTQDNIIIDYLKQQNLEHLPEHEKKRRIYKLKLKDRLLTEHLLQRFILSQSNIVLIVVDQLTKEEQRLIEKIKNLYEQNELIIIHNFSKLVEEEDVKKYIEKDILFSYEVKAYSRIFAEVNLEGQFFVENRFNAQGKKLKDITHVIMANENSKAGRMFNDFALHYLRSRILAETQAKKFDIVQQLMEMLSLQIPEIVDIPSESFNPQSIVLHDSYIKTNLNTTALKSVSFDLLGDLKVFKGGLDPKYSIKYNDEILILEVEICGPYAATEKDQKQNANQIIKCGRTGYTIYEWHGFRSDINDRNQYISIRGVKKDLLSQLKPLSNNREKGEFRVIIPIDPSKCVLRDGSPEFEAITGVLQFKYALQQNSDDVEFF